MILTAGERIGIVGPNGVGKTTLMRAILGAVRAANRGEPLPESPSVVAGEIVVGKNTRVAYLDQARAKLDDDKSIFDDVRGEGGSDGRRTSAFAVASRWTSGATWSSSSSTRTSSGRRSARSRAASGRAWRWPRSCAKAPTSSLFDEPTNDLDLPTLGALEEMLSGVRRLGHRRHPRPRVPRPGGDRHPRLRGRPRRGRRAQVTRYAGGYQDYVAQRGARRPPTARPVAATVPVAVSVAAVAAPPPREAKDSAAPAPKGKTKGGSLTYAERLELETIVDRIDAAEAQVTEVERLLADPSLYARRGDEVVALQARLAAARQEAASLAARWEALEAKKNGA